MRISCLGIIAILASATSVSATTWYVPSQIPTIQAAIDTALAGDVILLADQTFAGPGNRDIDFAGKAVTVESESGNAVDCTIDCDGSAGDPHIAFIFDDEETQASVLRNITIIDGYNETLGLGGAITIYYSGANLQGPTIQGCIFRNNYGRYGGAIACIGYDTEPLIEDCVFTENSAWVGGALHCDSSGPSVVNCVFQANAAENAGGACSFCDVFDFPSFSGCLFAGNQANRGGALEIGEGSPSFENCVIIGNRADEDGGALSGGGGLISPHFSNCTISGNWAGRNGGAIQIYWHGETTLENTISWGNCADGEGDEFHLVAGQTLTCTCCDINEAGIAGEGTIVWNTGNIFVDPCFCNPANCSLAPTLEGDYTISTSSQCVNAPGCGQIGALGIGCTGPSPVLETSWGGIKALFRK